MNIAIVGSGIAGLSAAFALKRQAVSLAKRITVFERRQSTGLSQHSIEFECDGSPAGIDVPLRLMNRFQWPELHKLYRDLDVETVPVNVGLSFSDYGHPTCLKLDYRNLFGSSTHVFASSLARRIATDIFRFRSDGLQDLSSPWIHQYSFHEYLEHRKFSKEFRYRFLYPILSSTVCTCSFDALSSYPANVILQALAKIVYTNDARPSNLFRTRLGMQETSRRLLESAVDQIRLSTTVSGIRQHNDFVRLKFQTDGEVVSEDFDHVIVSTQANHALHMLEHPTALERQILEVFEYEDAEVVVHRDENLMPPNPKSWSAFNMISDAIDLQPTAMCTIWLNQFAPEFRFSTNVFQTINPLVKPDAKKTIQSVRLQRPIVKHRSALGWELIKQANSESGRRIWFVGSYASEGIPLLETGIVSSQRVAKVIGSGKCLLKPKH